ncbi:MAG TPA: selenide, water dikinase SelD [Candidatus Dormibacteraeota bacterium]
MPVEEVRLTTLSQGGGCATKIPQVELLTLLGGLALDGTDPDLLVGAGDDAAVWRLRNDLAAVLTTDFFAPIVDDPDDYGAIAAANALSDVYAMGGEPLCALNLVAWPGEDVLPAAVLQRVLTAAAAVVRDAGALVVGGHSVRDAEPKFGLAVLGTVHPDRVLSNAAGRPGDALILTKPLGTGVVANALRAGVAAPGIVSAACAVMRATNAAAARVALAHGVRCATDVTGFGLLGHARTLALGSQVGVEIRATALPALDGVAGLVVAGHVPGGSRRNQAFADTWTQWDSGVGEFERVLACDAQTSGGLLLAVAAEQRAPLLAALQQVGVQGWVVGRLSDGPPEPLRVVA